MLAAEAGVLENPWSARPEAQTTPDRWGGLEPGLRTRPFAGTFSPS